jgi:hypothetical protein
MPRIPMLLAGAVLAGALCLPAPAAVADQAPLPTVPGVCRPTAPQLPKAPVPNSPSVPAPVPKSPDVPKAPHGPGLDKACPTS